MHAAVAAARWWSLSRLVAYDIVAYDIDKQAPRPRIARVPDDPLVLFARNLRRLREEAGLSQEELGLRTGIDVSNISRYEAAKRDPGVRTVFRLAAGLGVDAARLFEGM
jgi:ribosome-binding protein aMBF1 (putative translation factor)